MLQIRVAKRYAEALAGLAEEQNKFDRVSEDVEILQRTLMDSRELVVFLKSPVVKKDKKMSILKELFEGQLSSLTMSFLFLLVDKGREDVLPQIIEQFLLLRDEKLGIAAVEVKTAAELSNEQIEHITRRFENITKKKVRASFSLDKQLKGGFVAKVADTMFDGSVKRQLELLRERFAEGTTHS